MQRGRGGRGPFFDFGDPFTGFGDRRNPMSSFFGGRDPFDDPFFTQPFGGMLGSSMFGPRLFGSSLFSDGGSFFGEPTPSGLIEDQPPPRLFGSSLFGDGGSFFGEPTPSGLIEDQPPPRLFGSSLFGDGGSFFGEPTPSGLIEDQPPPSNNSRGPIIEEISSDDEGDKGDNEKKDNPRKHSRPSKEPFVEDPDDLNEEKKSKHSELRHGYNRNEKGQTQPRSFSFQSSTVTYGGVNGAYYTSSSTRRMGGDGVVMAESKEADTTTGKATHRISKGIHEKGHTLTRKLNSDGRVDTMQALHNLNEDELDRFEETWRGNAQKHLPGWDQGFDMNRNMGVGAGSSRQNRQGGWALPSTTRMNSRVRRIPVEDGGRAEEVIISDGQSELRNYVWDRQSG
ncbi:uncharacterized protein [Aristolochia californica]|uniref:uncharacterized protein n=1 Tax=Aristolochia californica TaxID=171875 RepID=UPI0035DE780C